MKPHERKHDFEGVQNFRDFGGYRAGDRVMARHRFFRSAGHGQASEADLRRLAGFGLSAVIDLRRPEERGRSPSRRWENFSAALVENHDDHEGDERWDDLIRHSDLSASAFRGYYERYYDRAPLVPRHIDLFSRYFATLADTDGAILVHCSAGKDRTGMIVALTHALAGVHEDDILDDFLLTNDEARFDRQAPHFINYMQNEYGRAPSPEVVRTAMGVEAGYLARAFATIEREHGDVETYVRDVLGVDRAQRAKIERRLFE